MLFATKWLVYPLMAILLGVSLYLVPSWQVGSMVSAPMPSVGDLAMSVWMVIPVLVFAAVANPSILSLIETLSGPIIASVLYLMPMIAIRRVPALAPYRGRLSNVFVTVAGLVAVSGILLSIVP